MVINGHHETTGADEQIRSQNRGEKMREIYDSLIEKIRKRMEKETTLSVVTHRMISKGLISGEPVLQKLLNEDFAESPFTISYQR